MATLYKINCYFKCLNILSQEKLKDDVYTFEILEVFNGKTALGGHKALYGEKKSEAETLYEMKITLKINGLKKINLLILIFFL